MTQEKVPPQSVQTEQAVLGSLLSSEIDADAMSAVFELLGNDPKKQVFYNTKHQEIYKAIHSLYVNNESIDLVTVTQELITNNKFEYVGGLAYLDSLLDAVPISYNVQSYAQILYDYFLRREVLRKINRIQSSIYNYEDNISSIISELDDLPVIDGNGNGKPKKIENAVEFLAREKTKTPYIIEGLLPETGFTAIAGFAGMGKSSLAMQMMLSILSGLPFLNKFQVAPSDYHILYLNLENSEYTIDNLLNSQLKDYKINDSHLTRLFFPSCIAMSLDNRQDVRLISKWITDYHIEIVVIDPILDAFSGDQNDLTVVRKLIRQFREINSNICWTLLHHFKKGNDEDDLIQLMLGSVGFANAMTSIFGLRRYSRSVNPNYKKIEFGKTRDAQLPEEIKVCMNPVTRIFEIVSDGEGFKPANIDVVINVLDNDGSLDYKTLVARVEMMQGISERTAKNLVQSALATHKIKVNNGLYMLNKQIMPSYLEQTRSVPK